MDFRSTSNVILGDYDVVLRSDLKQIANSIGQVTILVPGARRFTARSRNIHTMRKVALSRGELCFALPLREISGVCRGVLLNTRSEDG